MKKDTKKNSTRQIAWIMGHRISIVNNSDTVDIKMSFEKDIPDDVLKKLISDMGFKSINNPDFKMVIQGEEIILTETCKINYNKYGKSVYVTKTREYIKSNDLLDFLKNDDDPVVDENQDA